MKQVQNYYNLNLIYITAKVHIVSILAVSVLKIYYKLNT